jgi:hypothetical protein
VFGLESVSADLLQQVRWRDGVTVPAAVLTEQSETTAMGSFSGIAVRIEAARSTTKPYNLRSIEDCALQVSVFDLRVSPV